MNKLPNVIYIQIDRTWTPADGCSPLEGSTHNAERINPDDAKYIRAGATMDRVQAMAALVCPYALAKNIFFVPDDKARVCEVDMSEKPPRCECGAMVKCEHVLAVELHESKEMATHGREND